MMIVKGRLLKKNSTRQDLNPYLLDSKSVLFRYTQIANIRLLHLTLDEALSQPGRSIDLSVFQVIMDIRKELMTA